MTDNQTVASFVATVDPKFRPIVERLVTVVAKAPEKLDVAVKWRQLTFAREGDFHHWICAIGVTSKAVPLTFHFGGLLSDPAGRFKVGTSKFGRQLVHRTPDEVDDAVVLDFVAQALARLQYFKDNWKAIQAGSLDPNA